MKDFSWSSIVYAFYLLLLFVVMFTILFSDYLSYIIWIIIDVSDEQKYIFALSF